MSMDVGGVVGLRHDHRAMIEEMAALPLPEAVREQALEIAFREDWDASIEKRHRLKEAIEVALLQAGEAAAQQGAICAMIEEMAAQPLPEVREQIAKLRKIIEWGGQHRLPIEYAIVLNGTTDMLVRLEAAAQQERARLQELEQAVMLAVINMDLERSGLTPDGNVRERLVAVLNGMGLPPAADTGAMMLQVDWWTWECAQCGWKAASARTVNFQQSVAEAVIRVHIESHKSEAVAHPPPTPEDR